MILGFLKVSGHSMLPTLKQGEYIVVSKLPYYMREPKNGDLVVFEAFGKLMIKRIVGYDKKYYQLAGDNMKDSLKVKALVKQDIVAKFLFKITWL